MLSDDRPDKDSDAASGASGSPEDRRRGRRRRLPFGRGAVLESTVSSHVVAVVDLSVGGAYLATRATVFPGQSLTLRLVLIGGGELRIPCEVVRVCPRGEAPDGFPPGVAIHFQELQAAVRDRLLVFVEEGRRKR
jgi:hypothetical protein